jgi:hypothetical protein
MYIFVGKFGENILSEFNCRYLKYMHIFLEYENFKIFDHGPYYHDPCSGRKFAS